MTLEQHSKKFKTKYGDGEFVVRSDGSVDLPMWLAAMLLHLSGIRAKKRRIQKKVINREVNRLLERVAQQRSS